MASRSKGLFFVSVPPSFFFTGSWSDSFSVMAHDNVPFQIDNEKWAKPWREESRRFEANGSYFLIKPSTVAVIAFTPVSIVGSATGRK